MSGRDRPKVRVIRYSGGPGRGAANTGRGLDPLPRSGPMGNRTVEHQPWCAKDCAAASTSVHTSNRVPVAPVGTELIGISVHLERLVTPAPVDVVAMEFTVDDEPRTYLVRPRQAQMLHRVLR